MDFASSCHRECGSATLQLRSVDGDATAPGFPSDGDRVGGHPRSVHVADEQVDLPVRRPGEVAGMEPEVKVGDLAGIGRHITQ